MNKLKVKYFEKMTDIKLSPEVGQTSISPETEASAAGGLSALDDKNKISLLGNLVNSKNQEQALEKTVPEESAQIQQEQAQPAQQTTEAPQEATQQAPQPDFIYIPKTELERFNAENPDSAVEAAINTENEAGLTNEQFE